MAYRGIIRQCEYLVVRNGTVSVECTSGVCCGCDIVLVVRDKTVLNRRDLILREKSLKIIIAGKFVKLGVQSHDLHGAVSVEIYMVVGVSKANSKRKRIRSLKGMDIRI